MPARRHTDSPINRRQFLGNSARNAAGVAAGMAAGVVPWGDEAAANSTRDGQVRVGVIGLRSQGRLLAFELARFADVRVESLCDVDLGQLSVAARQVAEIQSGESPRLETDFRRLLEDQRIDAVVVATPDHWHALMAAHAMAAGKDVYLEAPVTHSLEEGTRLAELSRQTGRIVQGGLPQRSGTHFQKAIEFVRNGGLGQVHLARAWTVHQKKSIGVKGDCAPPAEVDYDLWLGPAPLRPFQPNRFHQNWRAFWDYGCGELGNWGVQMLDIARWGLGAEYPLQVSAAGGKFHFRDDQQTPDTLSVHYSFLDATIVWEHRLWSSDAPEGRSTAAAFHGDQGTLIVDRGGWKVYGGAGAAGSVEDDLPVRHLRNFVDCIKSRAMPNASLDVAVPSSTLCHLGCLAYRLSRSLNVDPQSGMPRNDPSADRLAKASYRTPWSWPRLPEHDSASPVSLT